MTLESVNPATEEVVATYEEHSEDAIEKALQDSEAAFGKWRRTTFAERSALMRAAAAYLRSHSRRFADLMTLEMGKPVAQSEAEVEKCAWVCEFYADHAESFLAERPTPSGASESYVAFDPLGPVLAVMPWNFPFWQVFRFAAPALMAGNTGILKHASNVPGCALAIEEVFTGTGFPPGVFTTLLISGPRAEQLVADPRVRAVTLTGSELAGSKVAAATGRELKKTVLELGGSDPFIVLEDADLALAASTAVTARNQNTGQSCIAAKRFIVVESVVDEFVRLLAKGTAALVVGDPSDRATDVGPLARPDLRDTLHEQVTRSLAAGARLVAGGKPLDGAGYFYEPTILVDVESTMAASCEETFGPVAAVTAVKNADEAIAVANDTQFGLGAALWTSNLEQARKLARQIEAGAVFINGMVASDPRLPFGGVKRSGYGRELGEFGIREFVNTKTVWIGPVGS